MEPRQPRLSVHLPKLSALAFVLSGCVLDWYSAAREPTEQETLDARVPRNVNMYADAEHPNVADARQTGSDARENDPDANDDSQCSPANCEHGTCNDAGGCDCAPAYSFDDGQCEPTRCVGVTCDVRERCDLVDGDPVCRCKQGYTRCDERCVDILNDREHCGGCDSPCATRLGCREGECEQRVHTLALDEAATCALLQTTRPDPVYPLRCWGRGDRELYRLEGTSESHVPRSVDNVPEARDITMSNHRRCVILPKSDQVTCWGRCRRECSLSYLQFSDDESLLHDFTLDGVHMLSTADGWDGFQGVGGNTCMLDKGGRLTCVGDSIFITDGYRIGNLSPTEIRVDGIASPKFRDVSGVALHICAALDEGVDGGRIACWGKPDATLLGAQSHCPDYQPGGQCTHEQVVAVIVLRADGNELTKALTVRAGSVFSCAVTSDHDVYCWGANGSLGLLGANRTDSPQGAVKIAAEDEFVEVAVGGVFACARAASGQVYCWGERGSVGLGERMGDASDGLYFKTPQPVPDLPDARNIWAGHAHACAQVRSGEVLCWGDNSFGQLGTGDTDPRATPTPVKDLK